MVRRSTWQAVIATAAAVGLAASGYAERTSVERANRMHRDGQDARAVELYRERTRTDPATPELRYNLGTSLVGVDDPSAEAELARALASGTRDVRGRAQYNTGRLRLDRALTAGTADSVRAHAAASVVANREALRLVPDDENAVWNLAMALRLLDSIDSYERRSGRELNDGAVEADVVTRSVNVPDPAEDERAQDPPQEGESETVATTGDEGPLSAEEAEEILGRTHLDATDMLTKLLALESRTHWGRRPSSGARRW